MKTPERIYSSESFKHNAVRSLLLFVHAFRRCDTTSTSYFKEKSKIIALLEKDESLRETADIFNKPCIHPNDIEFAGQVIFVALYGGATCKDTLSELRFEKFTQSAIKSKVNLHSICRKLRFMSLP